MVDQQQTYTQYDGIYANRLKVKAKHPNYLPCIECQWTTPINQVLYQHQNLWVYSLMQTLHSTVIERLAKKVACGIAAIKGVRQYIPPATLHLVYKTLIQPHFDYCTLTIVFLAPNVLTLCLWK